MVCDSLHGTLWSVSIRKWISPSKAYETTGKSGGKKSCIILCKP